MSKFKGDNVLDPNAKARWSFTIKNGQVVAGSQTVAETGGADTVRERKEDAEPRKSTSGTTKKAE